MDFLKKHKWFINWAAFATLCLMFIVFAIFFEDKIWIGNVLQALGTISAIYLSLLIFLQSKESTDNQFREHLNHLQSLNHNQIEALQKFIDTQIKIANELNSKQIEALMNSTEKQINALQKSTQNQINAFETQLKEVTDKLKDNSILLAEILSRELEKSINIYNDAIRREEARYKDLSGFKLLRTPEEKNQQLKKQWSKIEQIKKGYDFLVEKYNNVLNFLGLGNK